MLEIDLAKVCFIVVKAREFHAKTAVVEPDPGSNPSDERFLEVLADYGDDPVLSELRTYIADLNEDETAQLIALTWLGRGDVGRDEWDAAVTDARLVEPARMPDYLIAKPLLADYLEEGLSQFDLSCLDFEREHL